MKTRATYLTASISCLAVLLLGLDSATAKPEELIVDGVDPDVASQGELNKPVKIKGQGFDDTAKVAFVISGTNDTGEIVVRSVSYNRETGDLDTVIDVPQGAIVARYDVMVTASRGRKGKGTELFAVKASDNVVLCEDAFDPGPSTCTCTFTRSASSGNILEIVGDCETGETLYLSDYHFNGTDNAATITVTADFEGEAVVAATNNAPMFRNMHIHLGPDVNAGCGTGQLNTFIRYVLDGSTAHLPGPEPDSHMLAYYNLLTTSGPAVCHAIEARRTADFSGPLDFKVAIEGNTVADGTYRKSGILYQGFGPMSSRAGARLSVGGNIIGRAAGTDIELANAIQFGPLGGPAGEVMDNVINSNTGTGILVVGGGTLVNSETLIGHNTVQGAVVAVLVDENITRAEITSNTLVGDNDPAVYDLGICTDAASNRTNPNRISGFDDARLERPGEIGGVTATCSDLANAY